MIAYLFDIDGVLADPVTKQVEEEKLFDVLLRLLQKKNPVAFNTGRSLPWIRERIITPLASRIPSQDLLSNLIAIGEKGGTWMTFSQKDKNFNSCHSREGGNLAPSIPESEGLEKRMICSKDTSLIIPQALSQKIKQLIATKYHESMFFDATKETMISIEMHDGHAISFFHKQRAALLHDLKQILEKFGLEKTYKIDPTIIATDIELSYVGKALGARRFLAWLSEKDLIPKEFIAFGDSVSDFEMCDELHGQGKRVKMVYVGEISHVSQKEKGYPVEYVGGFTQGTLRYFMGKDT